MSEGGNCEVCGAYVGRWPNGEGSPRFPHARLDLYTSKGTIEPCPAGKSNPARQ